MNEEVVTERILEIMNQEIAVFLHTIPFIYQQRYKEPIPDDWKTIILNLRRVGLRCGANDSLMLCQEIFNQSNQQTSDNQAPPQEFGVCPEMVYARVPDYHWEIYVTAAESMDKIMVQHDNQQLRERVYEMAKEMNDHYKLVTCVPKKIEKYNYYAYIKDSVTVRALLLTSDPELQQVKVFLIDAAEEETGSVQQLRVLDEQFYSVPAMGTRIRLDLSEEFEHSSRSMLTILNKHLVGKHFIANVITRECDEIGPIMNVCLHNDKKENINDEIMLEILEPYTPKIKMADHLLSVRVTHYYGDGDVYIQTKFAAVSLLKNTLIKLQRYKLTTDAKLKHAASMVEPALIYLARCDSSGNWFRARLRYVDMEKKEEVRLGMICVDSGVTFRSDPREVLELAGISKFLELLACQATKVRLHKVVFPAADLLTLRRYRQYIPLNENLKMQVKTEPGEESMRSSKVPYPEIELFREEEHRGLVSINDQLIASISTES